MVYWFILNTGIYFFYTIGIFSYTLAPIQMVETRFSDAAPGETLSTAALPKGMLELTRAETMIGRSEEDVLETTEDNEEIVPKRGVVIRLFLYLFGTCLPLPTCAVLGYVLT